MTTAPLNVSVGIILNASGNGTAKVGPLSAREVWHPENVHVSTNQAPASIVKEAECQIYVGDSASYQQNFRDATYSGSHGDSTSRVNADEVKCSQFIWAVWTSGDANANAILTVTGTKEV
jgi:hypothetical protein